jgi:hypothetical protein
LIKQTKITSLGDSSGSDASHGCGDGDGDDLTDGEDHAADLGDEDRGHGLVQGRSVHVDGRAYRQNEPEKNSFDFVEFGISYGILVYYCI